MSTKRSDPPRAESPDFSKSKRQLLQELPVKESKLGAIVYTRAMPKVLVACVEDIETSLNAASQRVSEASRAQTQALSELTVALQKASKASGKLTVALVFLTAIIAFAAVASFVVSAAR